jgi:hypothetical protein
MAYVKIKTVRSILYLHGVRLFSQRLRFQDTIRRYHDQQVREHGRPPVLEPYHMAQLRYELLTLTFRTVFRVVGTSMRLLDTSRGHRISKRMSKFSDESRAPCAIQSNHL